MTLDQVISRIRLTNMSRTDPAADAAMFAGRVILEAFEAVRHGKLVHGLTTVIAFAGLRILVAWGDPVPEGIEDLLCAYESGAS